MTTLNETSITVRFFSLPLAKKIEIVKWLNMEIVDTTDFKKICSAAINRGELPKLKMHIDSNY